MKNILKISLISLTVFIFTGCYQMDAKMNIRDDKSLNLTILHTINEPLLLNSKYKDKNISEVLKIEQIKRNLSKENYTIDDYSKNGNKGVLISKEFKNIDDISTTKKIEVKLNDIINDDFNHKKMFKVKKEKLNNTYEANFIIDTTNNYGIESDLNYEIILPNPAIKSNATHISNDGVVLTWKLENNKINKINFTFKIREKKLISNILITAAIIISIIIFILVIKKIGEKD